MVAKRYKLRTVVRTTDGDAADWVLTFDPVRVGGAPVVIHLTDEQYEQALVRLPLERLAEEIERLRELE